MVRGQFTGLMWFSKCSCCTAKGPVRANDRTVAIEHSRLMNRRLKRAGKSVRFIELKAGDHNLSLEKNRIRFLTELEAFLAEHIGK